MYDVRGNGGIFDLFTVEVGERRVGSAEWTDILFSVFDVLGVFSVDEVSDERVKSVASFGNLFSCGYNLFFVKADWELDDTGSRLTVVRGVAKIVGFEVFERFVF